MVIFNDPLPCDDPAGGALNLALAMRERMAGLCAGWRRYGHRLGHGIGISLAYATVGMVGSEGRYDYTASGTSVNLAARLCDEAADGEIFLSPRAFAAVEHRVEAEQAGELTLKGFSTPVDVFRVVQD
jgi:class 3 adenylate cyclase